MRVQFLLAALKERKMRKLILVLALCLFPSIAQAKFTNNNDPFTFAGHIAVGVGVQAPYATNQIGLRIEEKHLFTAWEVSSLFQYGFAFDTLVYFYRSKAFKLHLIDVGMGFNTFGQYLSVPNYKRDIDTRLGAGAEIRVWKHAMVAIDWRASLPNVFSTLFSEPDHGRAMALESLRESQVYLGVVFH